MACDKCSDIHEAQKNGKTQESCRCDCHKNINPLTNPITTPYVPNYPYYPTNPCCPVLPDGTIAKIPQESKLLSPAHDWRTRTKMILDDILEVLEKKEDFGYFDSIIDVQTYALLIEKAMRKYVLEYNKRWCANNDGKMDEYMINMLTITKEELQKCYKGCYSTEYEERLERLIL